jgi:hypothetical protein
MSNTTINYSIILENQVKKPCARSERSLRSRTISLDQERAMTAALKAEITQILTQRVEPTDALVEQLRAVSIQQHVVIRGDPRGRVRQPAKI